MVGFALLRRPYSNLIGCFLICIKQIFYFLSSVFLATTFSSENYHILITALLLGAYVAIGIWFVIFLFKNIKTATTKASK